MQFETQCPGLENYLIIIPSCTAGYGTNVVEADYPIECTHNYDLHDCSNAHFQWC